MALFSNVLKRKVYEKKKKQKSNIQKEQVNAKNINAKYKDRVFKFIFGNPSNEEWTLSL